LLTRGLLTPCELLLQSGFKRLPPATAGGSDFMRERTLRVERLGRVEYGAALEIQKQTERAVLNGEQPDTLLLLEHPHTLT